MARDLMHIHEMDFVTSHNRREIDLVEI